MPKQFGPFQEKAFNAGVPIAVVKKLSPDWPQKIQGTTTAEEIENELRKAGYGRGPDLIKMAAFLLKHRPREIDRGW